MNITRWQLDWDTKLVSFRRAEDGEWAKYADVEAERERIREAVTRLTDAVREASQGFCESGWLSATAKLLRLARKADKAVKA